MKLNTKNEIQTKTIHPVHFIKYLANKRQNHGKVMLSDLTIFSHNALYQIDSQL